MVIFRAFTPIHVSVQSLCIITYLAFVWVRHFLVEVGSHVPYIRVSTVATRQLAYRCREDMTWSR